MTTNDPPLPSDPAVLRSRLQRLRLHGLLAHWDDVADKPWLAELCAYEEHERQRRSLERRLRYARIGAFKSMADFDWSWPKKIDKDAALDLLSLGFVDEGVNAITLGPNGVLLQGVPPPLPRRPLPPPFFRGRPPPLRGTPLHRPEHQQAFLRVGP